jgi:hypothetical protein
MKEGPGPIGGPEACQLGAVGGCEGVADLGGQPGELRGCCGCQALGERGAQVGELSMQELPTCRRGSSRRGKRVQVGSGGGEGAGCTRRGGNESCSARCRGKVADPEAPLAKRQMELEGGGSKRR